MNDSRQISSTGETEFKDPLLIWDSWDTIMKYMRQGLGKVDITHYLAVCTFVEEKGLLLHPPVGNRIERTLLAPPSIALTCCLSPLSDKQGGRMTH